LTCRNTTKDYFLFGRYQKISQESVITRKYRNSLVIQLSTDQFVSYTSQTAYWTFELGRIFVNNIYKVFQDSGITIPAGDLYMERLDFVQQLFELEDVSPVLHRQRMEIDFIRLIEEKQQEN
jgi:hypothetical protein